jgi:hypothetical protein
MILSCSRRLLSSRSLRGTPLPEINTAVAMLPHPNSHVFTVGAEQERARAEDIPLNGMFGVSLYASELHQARESLYKSTTRQSCYNWTCLTTSTLNIKLAHVVERNEIMLNNILYEYNNLQLYLCMFFRVSMRMRWQVSQRMLDDSKPIQQATAP